MKYTPRSTAMTSVSPYSQKAITLPPMPFDVPQSDGDETKPNAKVIRRKMRKCKPAKPAPYGVSMPECMVDVFDMVSP